MKRKILLACALVLISSAAIQAETYNSYNYKPVVSLITPYYYKYYKFDTYNLTAKFNPMPQNQEKLLTGSDKDNYKKIKKIENYISNNDYEKAIKVDTDYLPTYIAYYNYSLSKNDFHSAMNRLISIKRLNSTDKVLDDDVISYKLGMHYYLEKNYSGALTYLVNLINTHNPSEENLWLALGDIYFNLNNFEKSIEYLTKIPSTSVNYTSAQEILFNDYYSLQSFKEASVCAEQLAKREPSAINLIRQAATMEADDNTKLNLLYRARDLSFTSSDYTNLMRADTGIARIEQKKIDIAAGNLKGFVVKPDWAKIQAEVESLYTPAELSERQYNFFKSTNNCIARYKEQDLIKCFEYINQQEEKLSAAKIQEYQQEYEAQQREYDLMLRQQEFLERTYYNRLYMDEFYYMRPPYNYFFWW